MGRSLGPRLNFGIASDQALQAATAFTVATESRAGLKTTKHSVPESRYCINITGPSEIGTLYCSTPWDPLLYVANPPSDAATLAERLSSLPHACHGPQYVGWHLEPTAREPETVRMLSEGC